MSLLIINWIATTVAALLICVILRYLWDRSISGGHCANIDAYNRWGNLFSILSDVAMLLLPLPTIWTLRISRNLKIGLTIVFGMGGL